jgi:hypothetical protein
VWLEDDLKALLAIHRIPVRHHANVRTTNLVERSFVGERRRTRVIGCPIEVGVEYEVVVSARKRNGRRILSDATVVAPNGEKSRISRCRLDNNPPSPKGANRSDPTRFSAGRERVRAWHGWRTVVARHHSHCMGRVERTSGSGRCALEVAVASTG